MKKLSIFAAAALLLCSCASKNKYVIEGNVAGLEGKVYLFDRHGNLLDSAAVEAGAFRFEGVAAHPDIRTIADSADPQQQVHAFATMLFLEPGNIAITQNETEGAIAVSGTPSNDAYAIFNAAIKKLVEEYRNPETSAERREAIGEEYDKLSDETYAANIGNQLGVMLLKEKSYELTGQELLDEIAKFPAELKAGESLTALKEHAEKMAKTEAGQPYIDVAQPNAAGETVTLKSVVENPANKYTLVDFWASWCGPCMGEVPHLKKTYEAFHDKGFEIYGISFDRDRDKWLGAIEKNGMDWIHVSELNRFDNQAAKDYAVQAIPSNFLIDSTGAIVAKNLRGEELYEKVSELLGE